MTDLVAIVPSRGRPQAVAEMVEAFVDTCDPSTRTLVRLAFAVDGDDPRLPEYIQAVDAHGGTLLFTVSQPDGEAHSMVGTLNAAARSVLKHFDVQAIAFLGDDHRPRTKGWDTAYLEALENLPGLVYGNDLIQGANLPTQVAMSASVVRALGHMAPPTLTHLYVDNYWLALGQAVGCITYLPDVVVEHLHPVAGKAEWDEGYARVNDRSMYDKDAAAYAAYWAEYGARDVEAVRSAVVPV